MWTPLEVTVKNTNHSLAGTVDRRMREEMHKQIHLYRENLADDTVTLVILPTWSKESVRAISKDLFRQGMANTAIDTAESPFFCLMPKSVPLVLTVEPRMPVFPDSKYTVGGVIIVEPQTLGQVSEALKIRKILKLSTGQDPGPLTILFGPNTLGRVRASVLNNIKDEAADEDIHEQLRMRDAILRDCKTTEDDLTAVSEKQRALAKEESYLQVCVTQKRHAVILTEQILDLKNRNRELEAHVRNCRYQKRPMEECHDNEATNEELTFDGDSTQEDNYVPENLDDGPRLNVTAQSIKNRNRRERRKVKKLFTQKMDDTPPTHDSETDAKASPPTKKAKKLPPHMDPRVMVRPLKILTNVPDDEDDIASPSPAADAAEEEPGFECFSPIPATSPERPTVQLTQERREGPSRMCLPSPSYSEEAQSTPKKKVSRGTDPDRRDIPEHGELEETGQHTDNGAEMTVPGEEDSQDDDFIYSSQVTKPTKRGSHGRLSKTQPVGNDSDTAEAADRTYPAGKPSHGRGPRSKKQTSKEPPLGDPEAQRQERTKHLEPLESFYCRGPGEIEDIPMSRNELFDEITSLDASGVDKFYVFVPGMAKKQCAELLKRARKMGMISLSVEGPVISVFVFPNTHAVIYLDPRHGIKVDDAPEELKQLFLGPGLNRFCERYVATRNEVRRLLGLSKKEKGSTCSQDEQDGTADKTYVDVTLITRQLPKTTKEEDEIPLKTRLEVQTSLMKETFAQAIPLGHRAELDARRTKQDRLFMARAMMCNPGHPGRFLIQKGKECPFKRTEGKKTEGRYFCGTGEVQFSRGSLAKTEAVVKEKMGPEVSVFPGKHLWDALKSEGSENQAETANMLLASALFPAQVLAYFAILNCQEATLTGTEMMKIGKRFNEDIAKDIADGVSQTPWKAFPVTKNKREFFTDRLSCHAWQGEMSGRRFGVMNGVQCATAADLHSLTSGCNVHLWIAQMYSELITETAKARRREAEEPATRLYISSFRRASECFGDGTVAMHDLPVKLPVVRDAVGALLPVWPEPSTGTNQSLLVFPLQFELFENKPESAVVVLAVILVKYVTNGGAAGEGSSTGRKAKACEVTYSVEIPVMTSALRSGNVEELARRCTKFMTMVLTGVSETKKTWTFFLRKAVEPSVPMINVADTSCPLLYGLLGMRHLAFHGTCLEVDYQRDLKTEEAIREMLYTEVMGRNLLPPYLLREVLGRKVVPNKGFCSALFGVPVPEGYMFDEPVRSGFDHKYDKSLEEKRYKLQMKRMKELTDLDSQDSQ